MLRVGHFVTHPIQYFSPLYRELAERVDVHLTVLFGSSFGTEPSFDPGLGSKIQFDVPLLDGFTFEYLENVGDGKPSASYSSFDCPNIGEFLEKERFDVLWMHGWGYRAQHQIAAAAKRRSIPYLLRGESTLVEAPKYSLRWWRRKLMMRSLLRDAAGCLYVGRNNLAFYKSLGLSDVRLYPAHYSVDTKRFEEQVKSGAPRDDVRARLGCEMNRSVVVTVAKLIQRKRVADVIQAVSRLGPDCELWVIGDGEERESLQALANEVLPSRVKWLGFTNQSEIPEILNAADLFVLASDEETWGLVVNEAMACGLPCVVSTKVGCAADLIHEGLTGCVFPYGDIAALTDMLRRCVADKVRLAAMGKAARKLVHEQYSVQATAEQIVRATQAVVAKRRL